MGELEKKAHSLEELLTTLMNTSKMQELAQVLVDINEFQLEIEKKISDDAKLDESVDLTTVKNRLTRKTEDLFTEFGKSNIPNLLDLSYELLVLEAEKGKKFLFGFLEGQVKPHKLVEIICSNSYNKNTKQMVPEPKKFFSLVIGQDLYLSYTENAKGSEALCLVDQKQGPNTPKGGSKNKKKAKKKEFDKFQFILTKQHGFLIKAGPNIIMSEYGRVELANSQGLVVGAPQKKNNEVEEYKDGMIWSLNSSKWAQDDLPYFYFEQPYHQMPPRLVISSKNQNAKELTITCKSSDGYED